MTTYESNMKMHEHLKNNKNIVSYNQDELIYLTTPLGLAAYNKEKERIPISNPGASKKELYAGLMDTLNLDYIGKSQEDDIFKGRPNPKKDKLKKKEDIYDKEYILPGPPISYEPKKWDDRLKCDICGKIYTRANRSSHCRSKYHQTFNSVNKKLLKFFHPDVEYYPTDH